MSRSRVLPRRSEPNLWLFNFGLIISTQQLVNDYRTLKGVIAGINPEWLLIGNDCAFQIPIVGEVGAEDSFPSGTCLPCSRPHEWHVCGCACT